MYTVVAEGSVALGMPDRSVDLGGVWMCVWFGEVGPICRSPF